MNPGLRSATNDKDWAIELGSGVLISDVRTDLPGYTLVPAAFTAVFKVDDVSLDNEVGGILRGNTEFLFRGLGLAVVEGFESRFIGFQFGPRYNFVQPGWKFVPFVEGHVGFSFTDSQGVTLARGEVGQGQDFVFNFGIAAGVRYDISDAWYLSLAGMYTHFSNAGLSDPERKNRAMDAAGTLLSVGYRF